MSDELDDLEEEAEEPERLARLGWVGEQPEDCGHQADGTFVLKLEEPITVGSGPSIDRLTFRKLKGRDVMDMPPEPKRMGDLMKLAARLTGVNPRYLDEVTGSDVMRVLEVTGNFLGGSPLLIGARDTASSL